MKKMLRVIMLMMVLEVALAVLSACGGGSGGGASSVKGEEQSWGNISVFVPNGFTLTGGSLIDKEDPNTLWVQQATTKYFLVNVVSAEQAESNISMTKELNEGDDVSIKARGIEFSGTYYKSGGIPCWMVAGEVDGTTYQVGSAGFEPDDDVVTAVLSSLKAAE